MSVHTLFSFLSAWRVPVDAEFDQAMKDITDEDKVPADSLFKVVCEVAKVHSPVSIDH